MPGQATATNIAVNIAAISRAPGLGRQQHPGGAPTPVAARGLKSRAAGDQARTLESCRVPPSFARVTGPDSTGGSSGRVVAADIGPSQLTTGDERRIGWLPGDIRHHAIATAKRVGAAAGSGSRPPSRHPPRRSHWRLRLG